MTTIAKHATAATKKSKPIDHTTTGSVVTALTRLIALPGPNVPPSKS
jgi:hypothetical protein